MVLSLYAGVLSGTGQMVAAVAVERGLGGRLRRRLQRDPVKKHLVVR